MAARKFPDLTIVIAHCGGGIFVHEAILVAEFCPNVVLEMSTLMSLHTMEVLDHVPNSRLMIGSDLPESAEIEISEILMLDISDDDKCNILGRTAREVFDNAC